MTDSIVEISRQFFTLMGLEITDLAVECQDQKKRIYLVHVKTPDSKLIIGIHGQTLEVTKHLLTRIVEKRLDDSFLIHLEVNDYLQAKDDKFFRYLDGRVSYVMRVGGEITLPNLSSYERKKAHGYISEKSISGLKTYSMGEWADRALHLSYELPEWAPRPAHTSPAPRKIDMSIDDDGVGI